jgi:uncharacterized protein
MLSFDIRSLREQAVTVDAELLHTDPIWQEGDPLPADSVHVTGRLSAAGPGRFYWHGRLSGEIAGPCRRCLNEAKAPVDDEAHLIFAEEAGDEADDPDVFVIDPGAHELDLRHAVREQWLLAAPAFLECRPDCKGLCPRCGADLNAGPCECPPATDARWDALRAPHGAAE